LSTVLGCVEPLHRARIGHAQGNGLRVGSAVRSFAREDRTDATRWESVVDHLVLWAGGWALSVATWWPIQVVFHTDRIVGDGGLGGIGLLVMFVAWVGSRSSEGVVP